MKHSLCSHCPEFVQKPITYTTTLFSKSFFIKLISLKDASSPGRYQYLELWKLRLEIISHKSRS